MAEYLYAASQRVLVFFVVYNCLEKQLKWLGDGRKNWLTEWIAMHCHI